MFSYKYHQRCNNENKFAIFNDSENVKMNNKSVLLPFRSQQNNDRYMYNVYYLTIVRQCTAAQRWCFCSGKKPFKQKHKQRENEIDERHREMRKIQRCSIKDFLVFITVIKAA